MPPTTFNPSVAIDLAHPPTISIVIPCRNEEAHIGACLESLCRLRSAPSFDVILMDNGSTDRTIGIASSFQARLHLRIASMPGVSIAALRNRGAYLTQGRILAFLDADCIPAPNWLETVAELLEEPGCGIVGSFYDIPSRSSWVARAWESRVAQPRRSVNYVPGGDLLLLRSTFDQAGGFDEGIQTNEDSEFCRRVRCLGFAILADPALAVVHLGSAQTLGHFYRKQKWHGTHVLKVFLRTPFRSGNEKAILFAFYVLALELAILITMLVALTTAHWKPLAASVALMLLPPALLSLRRTRQARPWHEFPGLVLLYSTYGLARAHCLVPLPRAR